MPETVEVALDPVPAASPRRTGRPCSNFGQILRAAPVASCAVPVQRPPDWPAWVLPVPCMNRSNQPVP